jgi:DNA-binding beta-propeller fold protein YncE
MTLWSRRFMLGAGAAALAGCAHGGARTGATGGALYVLGRASVLRVDATTGATTELVGPVRRGGAVNDGIAIDRARGHIYWSNMGEPRVADGTIWRCDMDGSNVELITGAAFTPKQIQLHDGWIYWSDREGMSVRRVRTDGTSVETLVVTGDIGADDERAWCVGLAIDASRGRLYWTQKGADNAHQGVIRRAGLNLPAGADPARRPDVETLFSRLPEPIDLDLDEAGNVLYWTDRGDNTVSRTQLRDGAGLERQVLVRGLKEAIGITLDLPNKRLAHASLGGEVGVAGLDGSNARIIASGLGLLTGIAWG